jgi:hypothetical protein
MEELIGYIILFVVLLIPYMINKSVENEFYHRLPPRGHEVDRDALCHDLEFGKPKIDVMKKCNNGGYDVKKK